MSKWQKEYPVDFSPHGDNQGQAVQKQDNEMTAIYEKLNKVLSRRYSDWNSASDLERGEIIVKGGYKLTVQKNNRQTIINILKDGSVESDTNEEVNALGYEYVGRIPVLNFRSDLLGGYIRIAKVSSSPEAYAIPAPDIARRGGIEVSLTAAKLLPSCTLPLTRIFKNANATVVLPYPFRMVDTKNSGNVVYYRAANETGTQLFRIRYYVRLSQSDWMNFYIQNYQSDNSIYCGRSLYHYPLSESPEHAFYNTYRINLSYGTLHMGEFIYSPKHSIRTLVNFGTSDNSDKYTAYMVGSRWRNTGDDLRDYLGLSHWSSDVIQNSIIVIERLL